MEFYWFLFLMRYLEQYRDFSVITTRCSSDANSSELGFSAVASPLMYFLVPRNKDIRMDFVELSQRCMFLE
jgi:hypothetical protein